MIPSTVIRSAAATFARRAVLGASATFALPLTASVMYAVYEYSYTPEDQISISHTPTSIWYQSLTNLLMTQLGKRTAKNLEKACQNAAIENETLLLDLIQRCHDTAYGRDMNFKNIQSREDFRRMHPLTDHGHFQPYIDRAVMDGEDNVMFPEEPTMIARTSGTSGTIKLIPVSPLQRKVFFSEGIGITFDAMVRGVNHESERSGLGVKWPNLQKSCKLMYSPKYSKTVSGLKIGPNSSAPGDNRALLQLYSTPASAYNANSEQDVIFCHCLFALLDQNLGLIESNFVSGVFNFFTCIDDRWEELMDTIQSGKLPVNLGVSDSIRIELERELVPNTERAIELRSIRRSMSDGTFSAEPSFARLTWPKLHTIMANETGSFNLCGRRLREEWVGNKVPIFSPLYAATEGLIGVNPHLNGKTFVLNPRTMFFEFLPVDIDTDQTLFIEQLKPGVEYEMIITNLTGLYRYRFGDVVRCVGYKGEAPIVEIAYRKGQFLNAQGERTSEEAFYSALSKAAKEDWTCQLLDYTTVEHFLKSSESKRPPRYTVYVELAECSSGRGQPLTHSLNDSQIDALDRRLGEENRVYDFVRSSGRLQRVEVIVVLPGTFEKLRRVMIDDLGTSPTQTKQPRVTRHPKLVKILEDSAMAA
uniref:GH3 auxin-responsive promoter n=1 Tax=Odontella aurita TaxID=265563 RepID=A0A7S4IET5_9STRA|mmetsp:Transcript_2410/g.6343  ORF Transcript_2410/g.6343 Transcript_2410/m.6343 type:complete len:645 (+) Transcript_2410:148-2082(+)